MSHFPDTRLVMTGHSGDGKSIFVYDGLRKPFAPFGLAGPQFTSFHASPAVPASNSASIPDLPAGAVPHCPPAGVLFVTTDIPADCSVPKHRTRTADYAVVLAGEVVLALEGTKKTIKAGETMMQRGTNHAWHNRTDTPCRILLVMVGAEAIQLADGRVLE
ncbi:hypothetical protein GGX14DRAFT_654394 [Mycena pura]|uniref:Cupin type-2 domain-containing protein n=1 Tax=Mycena pura TaxID=153505 RepID=A0AAD6VBG7_9AGAR|nr:hypothetical protein GGX14DRAFT_654394 [Mycena pura]